MVNFSLTTINGTELYEFATAAEALPILEGVFAALDSTALSSVTVSIKKQVAGGVLPIRRIA